MQEEELKVYLRLHGEMTDRFTRIKEHMGLKNDTEVLRSLINWYWRNYRDELRPSLEHYNLKPDGVMILDRDLNKVIQIHFNPDGIFCEQCGNPTCKHVEFTLSIPAVQEILRKRERAR